MIYTMKRLSLLALKSDNEDIYKQLIRTQAVELKRCEDIPSCAVVDNSADREKVNEQIKRAEEAVEYVTEQTERYNTAHGKVDAVQIAKGSFARPKAEVDFDSFIGFAARRIIYARK